MFSSVKEVGEVVLAIFFKVEVVNSESDILPILYRHSAIWGLQGKVLNS